MVRKHILASSSEMIVDGNTDSAAIFLQLDIHTTLPRIEVGVSNTRRHIFLTTESKLMSGQTY